ncbi:MAG: type II secretion system protein [Zavarzinella sp.]|nr:type II secretion system protein [Zavarzinella sp.]
MRRHNRARGAFTLIEMIVVISIIALLMTLTAAAVMRLRESSRESNTNVHLNKIHMELQKQWNSQLALIKAETLPPAIVELTKDQNGNPDLARARALHTKLRLRQEFPQRFEELTPITLPPVNGSSAYVYPVKPAFKTALKAPVAVEVVPESQSAALVYLILSQGSGGSTTDVDSIARTKLMDYPQQNNAPPIQLKVFADEWGNHIGFHRWADDDMTDVLAELNQPPFVAPAPPPQPGQLLKTDPQDPDGRLQLPAQNWFTNNGTNYRQAALSLLQTPRLQNPFDGKNRGPFVFSPGRNGRFRVLNTAPNSPPDDPTMAAETDLDNLYSYRIAGSGKGN